MVGPDFELFKIIEQRYIQDYTLLSKPKRVIKDEQLQESLRYFMERADIVLQHITIDIKALIQKGFVYLLRCNYGDAIFSFEKARDKEKDDIFCLLGLGWCFMEMQETVSSDHSFRSTAKEKSIHYLLQVSQNKDRKTRGFTISDHKWACRRALFGLSKLYDSPTERFDKLTVLNALVSHEPDIYSNLFTIAKLYNEVEMWDMAHNTLMLLSRKNIRSHLIDDLESQVKQHMIDYVLNTEASPKCPYGFGN